MAENKKDLYCPDCEQYPDNIIERYLEPIEEERIWDQKMGAYRLQDTNLDGVEYQQLCGICRTKLIYIDCETKFGYCDNVDCSYPDKKQNLYSVEMAKDFEDKGGSICWCKNCIKRDKKMLKNSPNF